jgi:predicted nucleotidyltransferase
MTKIRIHNDILNPALWNADETLKPDVRQHLLKIAQDFYIDTELKAPIKDIQILGSSTNYNWTQNSDIDLHILIDFRQINNDVELVKKMVDSLKTNWNKNHDINIKDHPIEIYIQDINAVNRSVGIFSILRNVWVRKPSKQTVVFNKEAIQQLYTNIVTQIKKAIKENNLEKLKSVLKLVYDTRELGLSKSGDYSTENIVFKILRTRGHLDNLKNAINSVYDQNNSLKQEINFKKN